MYFQFHKQVFYQENSKYITKNIPTTPITPPNTTTYIAQISSTRTIRQYHESCLENQVRRPLTFQWAKTMA